MQVHCTKQNSTNVKFSSSYSIINRGCWLLDSCSNIIINFIAPLYPQLIRMMLIWLDWWEFQEWLESWGHRKNTQKTWTLSADRNGDRNSARRQRHTSSQGSCASSSCRPPLSVEQYQPAFYK